MLLKCDKTCDTHTNGLHMHKSVHQILYFAPVLPWIAFLAAISVGQCRRLRRQPCAYMDEQNAKISKHKSCVQILFGMCVNYGGLVAGVVGWHSANRRLVTLCWKCVFCLVDPFWKCPSSRAQCSVSGWRFMCSHLLAGKLNNILAAGMQMTLFYLTMKLEFRL